MSSSSSGGGGIGFFGLLTVLFVGLKLTHYIDWSWWWVTAPLWAPIALFVAVALAGFVVTTTGFVIAWMFSRR